MSRSHLARHLACTTLLFVVACGGSSEKPSLVSLTSVPVGDATCPNGGTIVNTGIDKNGNGVLDANEITSTQEICNGSSGTGTTGGDLVTIDGDVGTNCPDGGKRIQTGVDTNGNGMLDPSEVTSTQYVCNQLPIAAYHIGSVSIGSQADLIAVQSYGVVIGDVTVTPEFAGNLSWPMLTQITGGFEIDGTDTSAAIDVQLTGLTNAEYIDIEDHPGITTLALDALTSASSIDTSDLPNVTSISFAKADTKFLDVENDPLLTTATFPTVASLEQVEVNNNNALTTLSLSSKAAIFNMNISNNGALTTITMDKVPTLGGVNVSNNGALTSISFQALTTINENVAIQGNGALATLNIPALAGITGSNASLFIGFNALTSLSWPVLASANSLTVQNEGSLASLSFPALTTASSLTLNSNGFTSLSMPLLTTTTSVDIEGNGALASLSFPALTTVSNLTLDNNGFTSLSMPLLTTTTSVDIEDNGVLTSLSAPVLATSTSLTIANNGQLPTCPIIDIVVKVLQSGMLTSWYYGGNDTTVSCTQTEQCSTSTIAGLTGSFHVCLNALDWADAQTACSTAFTDGNLVTFDSEADWLTFQAAVANTYYLNGNPWIGYNDIAVFGDWVGPTATVPGFEPAVSDTMFWNAGEPNDSGGVEHCAQINSAACYANDENCVNAFPFICRN